MAGFIRKMNSKRTTEEPGEERRGEGQCREEQQTETAKTVGLVPSAPVTLRLLSLKSMCVHPSPCS